MKNKILSYVTGAAALATLCVLPTGCIQDDVNGTRETTLTLTVATRADGTLSNTDMEANEQMKTLRVIVAKSGTNDIIYNVFEEGIDDNDYQRTITFGELTIEDSEEFDFYAIANEASLDLKTDLNSDNINLKELKGCIINRDYNIKEEDEAYPLIPQTAFQTIAVGANANTATIQLEFVVAKVNVQFINETGVEQTISNLSLAKANPGKGYLFNDTEEGVYIPSDATTYSDVSIAEEITVAADADENTPGVYAYLYPGANTEKGSYVLSAVWKDQTYQVDATTITSGSLVQSLDRGQQLNIVVTLTAEYDYTTNVMVNAWTEKSMNIPAFE